MAKGVRTATRVRKARHDSLDPAPESEDRIHLSGLVIVPREVYETGRGWTTVEGHDVYVLPSSRVAAVVGGPKRRYADGDVISSDLLEIDGELWEVTGPPAAYDKGSKRKATKIQIKRVGVGRS